MHWEAVCGGISFAFVFAASWSRGQWGACYALVRGEGLDLFLFVYWSQSLEERRYESAAGRCARSGPSSGWDLDEKQGPPHREVRMCLGSASQPSCGHRDTRSPSSLGNHTSYPPRFSAPAEKSVRQPCGISAQLPSNRHRTQRMRRGQGDFPLDAQGQGSGALPLGRFGPQRQLCTGTLLLPTSGWSFTPSGLQSARLRGGAPGPASHFQTLTVGSLLSLLFPSPHSSRSGL